MSYLVLSGIVVMVGGFMLRLNPLVVVVCAAQDHVAIQSHLQRVVRANARPFLRLTRVSGLCSLHG